MEKYVSSTENRKRWCQGRAGNPHQFEYYYYHLKPAGYPDARSYFEFRCIVCGRRRYTTDEDGHVELEDDGSLEWEKTPEPHPIRIRLLVAVDFIADDGSFRRISSHTNTWDTANWSDARLDQFRSDLLEAAYSAYQTARDFDLMPPSEAVDLPPE